METIFALVMMFISQFFSGLFGAQPETSQPVAIAPISAVVLSVVDGDTIKVDIDGNTETVRYIGIDTPEPYRDGEPACFSTEATERNRELVAEQTVELVADAENRDQFDRLLRYVYVDGVFVNEVLLQEGYATTLTIEPNTTKRAALQAVESAARAAGNGLWSACQSAEVVETTPVDTVPEPTEPAQVEVSQLSPGQQRLLDFLGIDTTIFSVTQEMIACAETAVGADRLAEITSGDIPTIAEGFRLVGCYRE